MVSRSAEFRVLWVGMMYTSLSYARDVRRLESDIASIEAEASATDEPMRTILREIASDLEKELAECDERWQSEGVESKPPAFELKETTK